MKENRNDLTQGSIAKKLLQFMVPMFGALVLQAMYGAVDILIVGRFGSTAGISGVSTGSSIVNMVVFTITALTTGLTVRMSLYLGKGKPEKLSDVVGGAICFFTVLCVVLAPIMLIFAKPLAVLMRSPTEALDQTTQYVRICGGGIFFIVGYNMISGISRGLGDSRMPLAFVGIACVVNIIGDLLLVAVFKMDSAGAAIATVAAQAVSVVLSILIIRRNNVPFSMSWSKIRFNSEVKAFIKVGAPIAFQEIMTQISFLALCAFINNLGLEASSGYGVANKIVNFIMLVPSALMQSMATFVAQNVGAGQEKRAKKAMLTGMCMGCSVGVCIALLIVFQGDTVSGIFSTDSAVIAKSAEYLLGFAPEAIVTCILFSFVGYFNGHSQTLFVMLQGIAQTFLVRLPMSYMMSIRENASLTYIGLAAPSATILGILLNVLFFVHFNKKAKKK